MANFQMQDGLVLTDVDVFGGDQMIQFDSTGRPTRTGIFVQIHRYIPPAGQVFMDALCQGPTNYSFQTGARLSYAKLSGTSDCTDMETNSTFSVAVNLTATATGDLNFLNEHSYTLDAGLIFIHHDVEASRGAVVTGSISDGSQDFISGASTRGAILRSEDGYFVVQPPGLAP